MAEEAFIYEAIRTPRGRGKANGSLHGIKPVSLVTGLIDELQTRNSELDPALVDDVILGCVSPVGDQGADIAKTAAIAAGLPDTVAGTQINRRIEGSGQRHDNQHRRKHLAPYVCRNLFSSCDFNPFQMSRILQ